MHYFAVVVVPGDTTIETARDAVHTLLEPYNENNWVDGQDQDLWWDWFQIGGRWTGVWNEYNPEEDPANKTGRPCPHCAGTGRPEREFLQLADGRCNQCFGDGLEVEWPTQWRDHPGDILPVARFTAGKYPMPYRLVLADGSYLLIESYVDDPAEKYGYRVERHSDEAWKKLVTEALEPYAEHALVVVDYHT